MFIKKVNDICFVHIFVKYNNYDDVNTYGNFCDLVSYKYFSFKGLNFNEEVIELPGISYWVNLGIVS